MDALFVQYMDALFVHIVYSGDLCIGWLLLKWLKLEIE